MIDLDEIEVTGPWAVGIDISSYMGFSVEAEHWYDKLKPKSKHVNYMDKDGKIYSVSSTSMYRPDSIDIEYPLSAKQARLLNAKECDAIFRDFEKGMMCRRFFDKKDIIHYAIKVFKENFSQNDFLYLGKDLHADATMTAVAGPDMDEFNSLSSKEKRQWIRDKYETIDMTHLGETGIN